MIIYFLIGLVIGYLIIGPLLILLLESVYDNDEGKYD